MKREDKVGPEGQMGFDLTNPKRLNRDSNQARNDNHVYEKGQDFT